MATDHPTSAPGIFHLPLTGRRNGKNLAVVGHAIVLDDEFTRTFLVPRRWNVCSGYPMRASSPRVFLHHIVYEHYHGPVPDGLQIDHINRDTLDNTPDNLRAVIGSVNLANCKRQSNNTSGFRGVTWAASKKRWYARIHCRGSGIYLGSYRSKEAAARAVNAGFRLYFPEVAIPNPEAESSP